MGKRGGVEARKVSLDSRLEQQEGGAGETILDVGL